jgi:hypothetical protein
MSLIYNNPSATLIIITLKIKKYLTPLKLLPNSEMKIHPPKRIFKKIILHNKIVFLPVLNNRIMFFAMKIANRWLQILKAMPMKGLILA